MDDKSLEAEQPTENLVSMVTPLNEQRELDRESFSRLIQHTIERNVTGIVVASDIGEFESLDEAVREEAIRFCKDESAVPIMIHVTDGKEEGSYLNHLRRTKRWIDIAIEVGAKAVLFDPYYVQLSGKVEALKLAHGIAAYRPGKIPKILDNNAHLHPMRRLAPSDVIDFIAENPDIHGIKDCSGTMSYLHEIPETVRDDFMIYQGADRVVALSLLKTSGKRKVNGVILPITNVAPELVSRVSLRPGITGQVLLTNTCKAVYGDNYDKTRRGIKYLLYRMGIIETPVMAQGDPVELSTDQLARFTGATGIEISKKVPANYLQFFDERPRQQP